MIIRRFLLLTGLVMTSALNAQVYEKLKPIKEKNRGQLTVVQKKDLYGYQNEKGKVVIKCVFEEAKDYNKGYAIVKSGGKYGMLSESGIYSIYPKYDKISKIDDNRVITKLGNFYGFCSPDGQTVIDPQYNSIDGFSNGTSWVKKKNGLMNVIDTLNKEMLPTDIKYKDYLDAKTFMLFSINKKLGLANYKEKKIIFNAEYTNITAVDTEKQIFALHDHKQGEIVDASHKSLLPRDENADFVTLNKKVYAQINKSMPQSTLYFVDTNETKTYNCVIKNTKSQLVKNTANKYGFLDRHFREIVPCEYDSIGEYKDNLCLIKKNGLIGYIDNDYQVVIEPQYRHGTEFSKGKAVVGTEDDNILLIDQQGKVDPEPLQDPRFLAHIIRGNYHKAAVIDVANHDIRLIVDNDIQLFKDNSFKFSLTFHFAGIGISGNNLYFPGAYCALKSSFTGTYQAINRRLNLYATDSEKVIWLEKVDSTILSKILTSDFLDEIKAVSHHYYRQLQPNKEDAAYNEFKSNHLLGTDESRLANISLSEEKGDVVEDGRIYFGPNSNANKYGYTNQINEFKSKVDKALKDYAPNIINAINSREGNETNASVDQLISSNSIQTQTNIYSMVNDEVNETSTLVRKIANDATVKYPDPQKVDLTKEKQTNIKKGRTSSPKKRSSKSKK